MFVFRPLCMAHSLVVACEKRSVLRTKEEPVMCILSEE
jgi:hypothetical protein